MPVCCQRQLCSNRPMCIYHTSQFVYLFVLIYLYYSANKLASTKYCKSNSLKGCQNTKKQSKKKIVHDKQTPTKTWSWLAKMDKSEDWKD